MNPGTNQKAYLRIFMAAAPVKGRQPTRAMMRSRIAPILKKMKDSHTVETVVRPMVLWTGLSRLLPEQYNKFQPVVIESMIFLLQELPVPRLTDKIVDQLALPPHADPGSRLSVLVKDMPCVQKLGQVICRTPGLDPEFKQTLTDLEDNLETIVYRQIHPMIAKQLRRLKPGNTVIPDRRILAEASVCAVVPADIITKGSKRPIPAVLKVVKPRVRKNLAGDLALLEKLAVFLDERKTNWGMRQFDFSGTLHQVRSLIENEIDLAAEQTHLIAARRYYQDQRHIVIPEPLPGSTPEMTVMTRREGKKITDVAGLTALQKKQLAETLARVCILKPIQELREISIFHGDPHAGNIAYRFDGDQPEIIFYDWAMMGRLTRRERFLMAFLAVGLLSAGRRAVFHAADLITNGGISKNPELESPVMELIDSVITDHSGGARGVLTSIEFFFEELTYLGVIFPTDLMMYKKAAVTLNGVLADIDPSFDRNGYLLREGAALFLDDLINLRFHRAILDEAWILYQHSIEKLLDLQKEIRLTIYRGCSQWLKRSQRTSPRHFPSH
ncbi:MAG: AarF/UbiB family protein [Thermodesulfobacteriota bacterium]